jgi:Xaa-Pro aminopeptidase
VDIPTHVKGYHADQTRTYLLGDGNKQITAMYDHLKEISDYLIETIKPGTKSSEIYENAIKKSKDLNAEEAFLSFGNGQKSQMIGHGVGLEINEPPILSPNDDSVIRENFVLALDLHMMDPDVGAMKLEDMFLVSGKGNEVLNITPRDLHRI